jgi:hypothetical protein
MKAAEHAGRSGETRQRIDDLVSKESVGGGFASQVLGRHVGVDGERFGG